jgi:IgA-specific serine endopeptidase
MNTKNTNKKKTLKKGRKGWVVAAAIIATIAGASALNQPSQTTPILTKTGQPSSPTTKAPSATVKEEKKSPTTAPEVQNPTVKVTAGTHFSEPVSGQTQTNNSEQKSNPSSDSKPSSSVKVEVNLGAGATTAKEKNSTPKIVAEVKADSSEKVTEKKAETVKDEKAKTETAPEVSSPVKPVPGKVLSAPTVKEEKSETKPVADEKKPAPVKEEAPKTPTVLEKQPKTETVKEETPKAEKPADTPQKQGETKVTEKVTDSKSEQKTSSDTSQVPSGQGQTVGGTTLTSTGETSTTVTEPAKGSETVTTPEVTPTPETGAEGETPAPVVPVTPVAPIISKIITTRTEVERTEILRGTQYITDDSMEVGQQVVDTEGNDGYTLNSYTVTLEDGLEVSRVLSGTSTVPAVDKVVRVGSKVVHHVVRETKEVTETTPILRGTRYVEDDTLLEGTQVVESEGSDGETVTKYSVVTEDGTEVSRTQTSTETKEATDKVVRVGTKKKIVTTTETVQEEEVVNFTTETKEDKSLDKGQRVVDVKGQDGKVVKTYTVTKENGTEVKRELSNVERTEPTAEVVRVGAKEVTTETVTEEEVVNFTTSTTSDINLDKGQRVVDVQGVNGKVVKTYTITKENGVEVKRELTATTRTEPTTEVVRIGAKNVTVHTFTKTEKIPYTTKIVERADWFENQRRVVTQGKDGKTNRLFQQTFINGVGSEPEYLRTETIPAVDKVIEVGTRQLISTIETKETTVLPSQTVRQPDSSMNIGETRTVQGEDGFVEHLVTKKVNNRTGEVLSTEKTVYRTKNATDTIEYYGTKEKVVDADDVVLPEREVRNPELVKEKYQLDVKNEDHRSTKKLHAQMSQAQKDKVSANQFDPDLIAAYRTTGLSQDDMNKLERILDVNKLNQEFATLLNRERASKGLAPATIADANSPLAKVATVRANEMADYGSLRYKGVKEGKHKRPDGSSWMTAYTQDELKQYGRMGENAAESSGNHWNVISITNEKYLADKFFTNWKNSPGHYKIMMMDAPNIQFYLSLGFANHSMTSGLANAHNVVAMMEVGSKNR